MVWPQPTGIPYMRMPFSPLILFLFILILGFLVAIVQLGALTIAFDKLGLSPGSAITLLFISLFGSAINLPLFVMEAQPPPERIPPSPLNRLLRMPEREFTGKTLVAVNVGGGVIPVGFSLYLFAHNPLPLWQVFTGIAGVALISHYMSRPIPGLGIGMPVFVAPISAALIAIMLNSELSAPLAYISGTLGVLLGADLLRINDIRKMGTPFASIGGAGTFDGIFITGVVAVLLA